MTIVYLGIFTENVWFWYSDPICFHIIINIYFRQFGTVLTLYCLNKNTHIHMSRYDCHILKSRFVSKTGIFALDSSLVRTKPSRRFLPHTDWYCYVFSTLCWTDCEKLYVSLHPTGQATLEVYGSKQSYALNWYKPNNYDDDDDGI